MDKIKQLVNIYTKPLSWILTILSGFILGFIMFFFTHLDQIYGNFGPTYYYILLISQLLISLLFGMNVTLLFHRFSQTGKLEKKEGFFSTFFSFISLLIAGCPACGITLASYLGLASVFSALPFFGLEIKILTIIVLIWINLILLKPIQCKL